MILAPSLATKPDMLQKALLNGILSIRQDYCPTARWEFFHALLHIVAVSDWDVQHVGIKTAFLHGVLPESQNRLHEATPWLRGSWKRRLGHAPYERALRDEAGQPHLEPDFFIKSWSSSASRALPVNGASITDKLPLKSRSPICPLGYSSSDYANCPTTTVY